MSMGTPVIITKTDGFWEPDKFKEDKHIIFAEKNDIITWKRKIDYLLSNEDFYFKLSREGRKLILNNKSNFQKNTDLLLYLAARSENINYLKKFYKKKIILLDRFTDSTLAYQHFGMGVNLDIIKKINDHILNNLKVNFTTNP